MTGRHPEGPPRPGLTYAQAVQWLRENYPAATLEDDPDWVDDMIRDLVEFGPPE